MTPTWRHLSVGDAGAARRRGWALVVAAIAIPAFIVAVVVTGPHFSTAAPPLAMTVLPIDTGYSYDGMAWSGDRLVVSRSRLHDAGDEYRLVEIDPSDSSIVDQRIPDRGGCQRLDESGPHNIDGRLAWTWRCILPEPGLHWRFEVLTAADLRGEVTVRSSVGSDGHAIRALDIHTDRILTSYGSRTCETLVRLGPNEIEPISIDVSGPGGDFNTGFRLDHVDCVETGVAILPATNKDGTLAFMASTDAIGRDGPPRLDTRFEIYVVPDGANSGKPLGFSVFSPTMLTWTPDSDALIVGGRTPLHRATWRVDATTGRATRILDFTMESPS